MTFPILSVHGVQILRPLKHFAPTVLTAVIDDWTKGMDLTFSFHDAKERFWGQLAWITDYCRMVLPSVSTVKMAIREKDRPCSEMHSPDFADSIAPAGPFLLHPYRPWERLLEESDGSKSQLFLLKECKPAYRHVRTSAEQQVAVAKIICLVYEKGHRDQEAHWTLDEVNELWPRTNLQRDPWVWHDMSDLRV